MRNEEPGSRITRTYSEALAAWASCALASSDAPITSWCWCRTAVCCSEASCASRSADVSACAATRCCQCVGHPDTRSATYCAAGPPKRRSAARGRRAPCPHGRRPAVLATAPCEAAATAPALGVSAHASGQDSSTRLDLRFEGGGLCFRLGGRVAGGGNVALERLTQDQAPTQLALCVIILAQTQMSNAKRKNPFNQVPREQGGQLPPPARGSHAQAPARRRRPCPDSASPRARPHRLSHAHHHSDAGDMQCEHVVTL
jgi:hypothetical protein